MAIDYAWISTFHKKWKFSSINYLHLRNEAYALIDNLMKSKSAVSCSIEQDKALISEPIHFYESWGNFNKNINSYESILTNLKELNRVSFATLISPFKYWNGTFIRFVIVVEKFYWNSMSERAPGIQLQHHFQIGPC